MFKPSAAVAACVLSFFAVGNAHAEGWFSGDWYLKLGAEGFSAPKYQGDNGNKLGWSPKIAIGRAGQGARFTSRNDSASVSLLDNGPISAGLAGRLISPRDEGDSADLKGMRRIKRGGELGGFAEAYPTDWLRVRGEVRQGFRSHSGVVADVSADVFTDIAPGIQVSAGPRATWVSKKYNERYYGVTPEQTAAGAPSPYSPNGGLHSVGVGAAITWKVTENAEIGSFAEYRRLTGDAGASTLVRERGSRNEFIVGVQASYKFGFSLP
ncbi:MipA/OmpV family protein [Agrobacterium tumefaciens]|uniref:MipA/OmpV family protein n=1 Tax=Agrobacterium tumefaciens TaxID=358 RepID=UPI00287C580B|nr:MipA/OmpV family protein [Agrobacterium tumefaciens]MDS7596325.1 MipA/OmpV family protein [Agrobacterium tumefaciens]